MNPNAVIEGLRLSIRALETEHDWRGAVLEMEAHLRVLEPAYPPPRLDWLERMAACRAVLAQNRAELELLLSHPEVTT